MNDENKSEKDKFFYPKSTYKGKFTPENLVADANFQEFAQKISYICNLETNGKISPQEAYVQIKQLWKSLRNSVKNLGIDKK